MRAYIYLKYGPPSVIALTEANKPFPKNNELLIEVHATTVNRTDTGMRAATYFISRFFSGLFAPKKSCQVQGSEFAGKVIEIGSDVTKFKVGDRVFGFDDVNWGGHAEYKVIADTAMVAVIPDNMSYEQAAPSTEAAHYVLFYIRAAQITGKTKVLVHGGTGAIGSSAIQVMLHLGADVTATTTTKSLDLVASLGANHVIDWQKNELSQIDTTYDVIFDAVGKSSWKICKPLLKKDGVYMSTELGDNGQNPILALWTKFRNKKVLFPLPKNQQADIDYLRDLMHKGSYKPVIDRVYDFKDLVLATEYVETGQKVGNVVVRMNP